MLRALCVGMFCFALCGCQLRIPDGLIGTPSASEAAGQAAQSATEITAPQLVFFKALESFAPLRAGSPMAVRVKLGRMLFHERRLSKNHDVSCASCHVLDMFGVDNARVARGHREQEGERNSPTVYNTAGYIAQFWDGRAADLTEQVKVPLLNRVEMAMKNPPAVMRVVRSMPPYVKLFKKAFPKNKKPATFHNLARAIAAFEERLITPGRFDAFLKGDKKALSAAELKGFLTFTRLGCPTCHNRAAIGGSSFQRLGQVIPYTKSKDPGRAGVTKNPVDQGVFKVPSLRNIAKTAPYFHDGSIKTLAEAVKTMAWHQLGKKLSDTEITEVVTFLKALTGELPTAYIAEPKLPASTKRTPKPDPS